VVRLLRPIACVALVSSASACTLWLLGTDPFAEKDSDASADSDLSDVMTTDAPNSSIQPMYAGVHAIASFNDVLYANIGGVLYSCKDTDTTSCSTLNVLVPVDAGVPTPVGLSASSAGVFWVTGDGIWFAGLDGTGAHKAITDVNNPGALAADGQRLSWTTLHAGSVVINTCKVATTAGCAFDGGVSSGTSQAQLVGPDANIDNKQLAAGPSYVAWATTDKNSLFKLTSVDGGVTFSYDSQFTALQDPSDNTWVTNDGPNVFVSFQNKADGRFVVYQTSPALNVLDASPTGGRVNGVNRNYSTSASAGVIGYGARVNVVIVFPEDGAAGSTELDWDGGTGASAQSLAFAATTHFYFLLAADYSLYRFAR
jgi:hypothetical protein